MAATDTKRQGFAHIKQEYVLPRAQPSSSTAASSAAVDDDAAEGAGPSLKRAAPASDEVATDERETKAARGADGGSQRGKSKARGQNKGRKFNHIQDDVRLCAHIASGAGCSYGDKCRESHSVELYLASKPAEVVIPLPSAYLDSAPFISGSALLAVRCPTFEELGSCPQGFKCRFLSAHYARPAAPETVGTLVVDEERKRAADAQKGGPTGEMNGLPSNTLFKLGRKKYEFPVTDAYIATIGGAPKAQVQLSEEDLANGLTEADVIAESRREADRDADDVPLKATEKRRLNWTGKPYLAPLTTTGNLPFRRLAASLGAEITCGEMALASSLVSGAKSEWSLTKRHKSEKMFGVQICGSKCCQPIQMASAAEVIAKECPDVDFVDCNIGCPIDLVFNSGAGSALMGNPNKLGKILTGMSRSLGEIPMTVKMRTGIHDNSPNAHKLVPRFATEWSAGALTIHGRSRQQRYSRLANWQYIKECVDVLRETVEEANLPPIPIFGGGDCYSYAHYKNSMDVSGVDGIMIARGALIKPWIFTEIQERREWDISAVERLDFIRQYAEFGLTHWGSDTQGVNTTRRFLCEYLSFTHRYIPIGLLETQPCNINDRPSPYKGRSELETLLASTDSRDWVKLSEMFLGPSPADFNFNPKHKSNAYGAEESQG